MAGTDSRRLFIAAALIVGAASLCGCAIPLNPFDGNNRVLIIGIGVVSTESDPGEEVLVVDSVSLGVEMNNYGGYQFSLGYANRNHILVANGAEVLVEVSGDGTRIENRLQLSPE